MPRCCRNSPALAGFSIGQAIIYTIKTKPNMTPSFCQPDHTSSKASLHSETDWCASISVSASLLPIIGHHLKIHDKRDPYSVPNDFVPITRTRSCRRLPFIFPSASGPLFCSPPVSLPVPHKPRFHSTCGCLCKTYTGGVYLAASLQARKPPLRRTGLLSQLGLPCYFVAPA